MKKPDLSKRCWTDYLAYSQSLGIATAEARVEAVAFAEVAALAERMQVA